MAKALSDIRGLVRSYLDEDTAADWTNAELNSLINTYYHQVYSAVMDVFEEYSPVSTTNLSTVADQQEYALPSDFLKVRRVEINYDTTNNNDASRALPTTLDSVRFNLGNANIGLGAVVNPAYYLRGNNIGFIPIPSNYDSNAIKVWYYPLKSDLSSDSDTIDIPYPDRDYLLIVWGAAAEALRFGQQESVEADKLDRKFERGLMQMQERLEDRVSDEAKGVVDISNTNTDFTRTDF